MAVRRSNLNPGQLLFRPRYAPNTKSHAPAQGRAWLSGSRSARGGTVLISSAEDQYTRTSTRDRRKLFLMRVGSFRPWSRNLRRSNTAFKTNSEHSVKWIVISGNWYQMDRRDAAAPHLGRREAMMRPSHRRGTRSSLHEEEYYRAAPPCRFAHSKLFQSSRQIQDWVEEAWQFVITRSEAKLLQDALQDEYEAAYRKQSNPYSVLAAIHVEPGVQSFLSPRTTDGLARGDLPALQRQGGRHAR